MPPFKPEECASPVVRALVEAYRNSRHGRTGAGRRRFSVRYEKLVDKLAQVTFKEEKQSRLLLERLRASGLIQWDHIPLQRDQIKTIYIAPASENAFFAAVNEAPPGNQRSAAVGTLAKHLDALRGHRYESAWRSALQQAMDDLNNGRSAEGLPNDTKLHDIIISATAAVLNNQKTTLIRRLGSEKLKDSKLLRRRQDTIERFMAEFLPPDLAMLEAWNIARTPLLVLLRGPLGIETDDGTHVGELVQGSPYTIKEEVLGSAQRVFTSATRCLVIENHTPFWEMAVSNAQDLIVHASYPSSSVVKLLQLLPATVSLQHWGDTDPWGYDILRVLREKTGRTIEPWRMNYRPHPGPPLSDRESAVLARLRADPRVADLRPELNAMFVANTKGDFEQDGMPFVEW